MSGKRKSGLHKADEELGFVDFTVHNAKSLQRMDARGLCDAYVVIALEHKDGEIASKQKTKVINQNLQPTWEQEFSFNVKSEEQVFQIRYEAATETLKEPKTSVNR
jgi:Ca2+-dependent lipid-binding protein